jgi:hypothetical protein
MMQKRTPNSGFLVKETHDGLFWLAWKVQRKKKILFGSAVLKREAQET